jgi:hypothetical protein
LMIAKAGAVTSGPMPSPGIKVILCFMVRAFLEYLVYTRCVAKWQFWPVVLQFQSA